MKLAAMLAVSVGLHAVAVGLAARAPRPAAPARMEPVEMTIVPEPEPPPPAPIAPPPAPSPAPAPRRPSRPAPPAVPVVDDSRAGPAAVPLPEPLDLTEGPAVVGPAPGPADPAPARGSGGAPGPPTVAAGDLSRPPTPPPLDDALARNYPRQAREAGRSGRAVLRARIQPDGTAVVLRVVSASAAEFGEACRRTLDGTRWAPPIDRAGRPVATEVSYTCSFEVGL